MGVADEISKLNQLKQNGAISEEEYQKAKETLLSGNQAAKGNFNHTGNKTAVDANMWGIFIHLSHFCGYIIPLGGLIVPIILWQIKKDESEIIDRHGRVVVNWIITEFILAIIFALMCFLLIGFPLLIILAVVGIIFPIVGAVKANKGEVWPYPCSIKFFASSPD
jgi:uncharacterized protein